MTRGGVATAPGCGGQGLGAVPRGGLGAELRRARLGGGASAGEPPPDLRRLSPESRAAVGRGAAAARRTWRRGGSGAAANAAWAGCRCCSSPSWWPGPTTRTWWSCACVSTGRAWAAAAASAAGRGRGARSGGLLPRQERSRFAGAFGVRGRLRAWRPDGEAFWRLRRCGRASVRGAGGLPARPRSARLRRGAARRKVRDFRSESVTRRKRCFRTKSEWLGGPFRSRLGGWFLVGSPSGVEVWFCLPLAASLLVLTPDCPAVPCGKGGPSRRTSAVCGTGLNRLP